MIKHVYAAVVLLATSTALGAADAATADRQLLLEHLNQSSAQFAKSIDGLTPEQWTFKPADGGWSIAECAEHIVLTEGVLRQMISEKVLVSPPKQERRTDGKDLDQQVLKMITDRSQKAQAPEPVRPSGQFNSPSAALQRFEAERQKTVAVATGSRELRAHTAPHFVFKELDAHQWLLYLSGHTMRHTAQIQDVKSSPGFPQRK